MNNQSASAIHLHLSRRESQIMDILYQLREATVAEVVIHMPDDPAYNTVRNKLAVLEEKGYVVHRKSGKKYVYVPTTPLSTAREKAAAHYVDTFFPGSAVQAIETLLAVTSGQLSGRDLENLGRSIEQLRQRRG